MRPIFIAFIITIVVMACQAPKTETQETPEASVPSPALTLKWQTDPSLTTCESVIYDKDNDVLYVSNINGAPDGKDGNGFISKVTLDGKISEVQWVKGMDAPKGMGIYDGKLYVTDIDRIHEIDIASGKIAKTYPVPGAKFLNDVTVDENGKVYISDMTSGQILLLEKGKVSNWLATNSPNGLLAEGNTLMMLSWEGKNFNAINVSTQQVDMKTDSIENPDGIEAVGNGGYLISSWNGLVHYITPDSKKILLLDTRADSLSAADIEYIAEKNLLLVPTFFKNTVMAYEFKK